MSVINTYAFGTVVSVSSSFTNAAGPIDPTTVTLRYKDPNGVEIVVTTASLTKISTGVYTFNIAGLVAGVWFYRFEGAGAAIAVQEASFNIAASQFADAAP